MPDVFDLIGDSVSPTEFVNIGIGYPKVYDNVGEFINVLESVTIVMASRLDVSVSDDDVATEAVTVRISVNVVVFDADLAAEVVAVVVTPLTLSVAEDDLAAEVVAVVVNPLTLSVSDDDGPTDAVVLAFQAEIEITVADAEAATEDVRLGLSDAIMVVDDVGPTEFVNVAPSLQIAVSDDNTYPPLEPPPMPATGIARDYIDVQEGFTMGLAIPVLATDDASETEAATVALGLPVLAVDTVPVVDVIATNAITINPVLVGFDGVVVDPVTPTDAVTVVRTLVLVVADDVPMTEFAGAALPMQVVAADTGAPTEAVDARSPVSVRVVDDAPSADVFAALVSVLLAHAADDVPNGDLVLAGIPMAIQVVDAPDGSADFAVAERRFVTVTGFPDDLHFINDATRHGSVTGARVTRKT